MSSQYLMPVSEMDSGVLFSCFNHHPSELGKQISPSLTNQTHQAREKRPWTSMKTTIVSKSASNPRASRFTDTNALVLSTEKKRNKLGYHRTSVACGHCRRRKIRCIPAPGDKRCSNCIRLKKECNFYPVDQQSPASGRRDPKGQYINEKKNEDCLLPLTKKKTQVSEISSLPYSSNLSMPIIQNLGCSQTKYYCTGSFSPDTDKVVSSEHDFNCSTGHVTTSGWISSGALSTTDTSQEISPYWISNTSKFQLPPAFSPFTPNLQISSPHDWNSHTELNSTENLPWPTSSSMTSYNNTQGSNNRLYAHNDNVSSKSSEHHTGKRASSTSVNPISNIGPTLASMNNNSEPRQLGSTLSMSTSIPVWQQPYSYQKSTNHNLGHFGTWTENQSNSMIMKAESDNGNLSSYIYDGFGTGIFYSPH